MIPYFSILFLPKIWHWNSPAGKKAAHSPTMHSCQEAYFPCQEKGMGPKMAFPDLTCWNLSQNKEKFLLQLDKNTLENDPHAHQQCYNSIWPHPNNSINMSASFLLEEQRHIVVCISPNTHLVQIMKFHSGNVDRAHCFQSRFVTFILTSLLNWYMHINNRDCACIIWQPFLLTFKFAVHFFSVTKLSRAILPKC